MKSVMPDTGEFSMVKADIRNSLRCLLIIELLLRSVSGVALDLLNAVKITIKCIKMHEI